LKKKEMVVLDFEKTKMSKADVSQKPEENFKNKKPSLEGSFSKIKHL
jgi:hypothetical protein